ncbi:MAG: DUF2914 domain-containing protein [Planctomycetota bacterium]
MSRFRRAAGPAGVRVPSPSPGRDMNQRVVLGLLIAGGLGIGLFAAVERVMRGAGRQVVKTHAPPREPETPVTLVSAPPKEVEAPMAVPGGERVSPRVIPAGMLPRLAEAVPLPKAPQVKPPKGAPVIERLAVCLGVKDRNPVGETTTVKSDASRVYCWMRVTGGTGKKVRPMWTLNGKSFPGAWMTIGSNSYRTWTAKKIDATSVGAAKLEIQDEKGRVLATQEFAVVGR